MTWCAASPGSRGEFMASIVSDPNGRKRILFVGADGKRRPIRLGKVPLRYAEAFKIKVEALVSAKITGAPLEDEVSRWLASLDDRLLNKLAKLGLVKPRESVGLQAFIDAYISGRVDIKPRTRINLEQTRRRLLSYFGANRALRSITPADAEDFRLHLVKARLSDNTIRRTIGRARQFFKAAIRRGLIPSNPFEGIAASVKSNPERFYFVSREEAQRVLDACPDAQWRLIFALARYGGLRCPSEILALKWGDVDWARNRIRVPSPKTEHHEGGASRIVPMFPELLPHLREVFEGAEPGTEYVVARYRDSGVNLRTQLERIVRRAGLEPWPKPFQNLRSTRETELAERFPIHVVCKWIGNSPAVAAQHYLQVTDEHFDRATQPLLHADDGGAAGKAAQNAAQQPAETTRNEPQLVRMDSQQSPGNAGVFEGAHAAAKTCEKWELPPDGLEPSTN